MSGKIFIKFTKLCETTFSGRSSTKVLPVRVYPSANSAKAIKVYAVIDKQSNNTLASVMKYLTTEMRYQPQRQQIHITIFRTQLITWCYYIQKNNTLLLIERDFGDAHHVLEQHIGSPNAPYAQKHHLGCVIVGEIWLERTHRPDVVVANKVVAMSDGRTSFTTSCPNNIIFKENLPKQIQPCLIPVTFHYIVNIVQFNMALRELNGHENLYLDIIYLLKTKSSF